MACENCVESSLFDPSEYDIVRGPFSTEEECSASCSVCSKKWNPEENCISYTTDTYGYYIKDSSSPKPPVGTEIKIPKKINIVISGTLCKEADGVYSFENQDVPADPNQEYPTYGTYVMSPSSSKMCPTGEGIDASLTIGGRALGGSITKQLRLRMKFKKIIIHAEIPVPIRYRREYGDWTFAESATANSRWTFSDPSADNYYENGKVLYSISAPDGGPEDRIYGNPCEPDSCSPQPTYLNNITVKLIGTDTCRAPLPTTECSTCDNAGSVDYTTLPNYPNYIDGCVGRSIDIDFDSCTGEIHPESFSKSNFVSYYQGGPNQPFIIVDNIAYDPRGISGLIKVFTSSSAEEMRNMTCSRLRFATLKDDTKLNSNLNEALASDWPYNDLYWFSACGNLPEEVPINLIPC